MERTSVEILSCLVFNVAVISIVCSNFVIKSDDMSIDCSIFFLKVFNTSLLLASLLFCETKSASMSEVSFLNSVIMVLQLASIAVTASSISVTF